MKPESPPTDSASVTTLMVCPGGPRWVMPTIALSIAVMAATGVVLSILLTLEVRRGQAEPVGTDPSVSSQALPLEGLVQVEMDRLTVQAQKDIASPDSPCFGRSLSCPIGHYEFDGWVKQEAAHRLLKQPGGANNE